MSKTAFDQCDLSLSSKVHIGLLRRCLIGDVWEDEFRGALGL